MNKLVRQLGTAVVFAAVTLTAAAASAQEISVGYQWQNFMIDLDDSVDVFVDDSFDVPFGLHFDIAGPVSDSIDLVGQFDWSRRSEGFDLFGEDFDASLDFSSFAGGIRWSSRASPSVTPFVQALFGAMRSSFSCDVPLFDCEDLFDDEDLSSVDPMLQIGGGLVFPIGGWGPLVQFDYRRLFADEGVNVFRFVAGVRFGLRD